MSLWLMFQLAAVWFLNPILSTWMVPFSLIDDLKTHMWRYYMPLCIRMQSWYNGIKVRYWVATSTKTESWHCRPNKRTELQTQVCKVRCQSFSVGDSEVFLGGLTSWSYIMAVFPYQARLSRYAKYLQTKKLYRSWVCMSGWSCFL